jgi:signal transduction histidine kinase
VALGLTILVVNADLADKASPASAVLDSLVGLAFVVGAVVAPGPWRARALFSAVGFTWLLGSLVPDSLLAYEGVLAVALVTFPAGRPSSASGWLLVSLSLVAVLARPADSVLAVLFAAVAVTATLGRRWERAAALYPAAGAAALACLLAAHAVAERQQPARFDQGMWLLAHEALLIVIAIGFPAAAWAIRRERVMLADRLLADEQAVGLSGLAAVLGATLGEPGLLVFHWDDGAGSYVDRDGGPAAIGEQASVIAVNDGHEPLALVAHGRSPAMQDSVVAQAVGETVRLAALNERWQRSQNAELAELEAARGRLVAATDRQRAAIAVRLSEDVVRAVESARVAIHRSHFSPTHDQGSASRAATREAHDALKVASEELTASVDELLALTEGLPPADLGEGGLLAALRGLADRCPLPVTINVGADVAADSQRETALFYVCSEALANAIKHAHAGHISIDLRHEPAGIALVVADDGVGGADPGGGTGLRGLADRVAVLDGRIRVESPPEGGTRVVAEIPLRA